MRNLIIPRMTNVMRIVNGKTFMVVNISKIGWILDITRTYNMKNIENTTVREEAMMISSLD